MLTEAQNTVAHCILTGVYSEPVENYYTCSQHLQGGHIEGGGNVASCESAETLRKLTIKLLMVYTHSCMIRGAL